MKSIAAAIAALFDLMMRPFGGLSPIVGMVVISAITGVLMLLVYKYTSNQPRIKEVKRLIKAHFLAIALYKESLHVLLKSSASIMRLNFGYMRLNVKPLLFMIIPVGLLLINIDAWYGYRAIRAGESLILTARVDPQIHLSRTEVKLRVPDGLWVETPAVRIQAEGEVSWRVGASKEGVYDVVVKIDNDEVTKRVTVSTGMKGLSPLRYTSGFWNSLLHPREPSISKNSSFTEVSIDYPATELDLFGWQIHWIYVYFVLSILFALPMRGLFRVDV